MRQRLCELVTQKWPGKLQIHAVTIRDPEGTDHIRKALAVGVATQSAIHQKNTDSHVTVDYNHEGLISPQSAVLYKGYDVSNRQQHVRETCAIILGYLDAKTKHQAGISFNARPTMMFVPASLIGQTFDEVIKHFGGLIDIKCWYDAPKEFTGGRYEATLINETWEQDLGPLSP
ncbi:hypothetical protein LQW54_001389 [Pestalotiopsis sp. IQ-011]